MPPFFLTILKSGQKPTPKNFFFMKYAGIITPSIKAVNIFSQFGKKFGAVVIFLARCYTFSGFRN
jgi:hypothetical protein